MTRPAGLKMPRAVLFDWDNTLVNTWPTIIECYHDTFTALGQKPWTGDEVRARAHGSLRDHFPKLFGEKARDIVVGDALGRIEPPPLHQRRCGIVHP